MRSAMPRVRAGEWSPPDGGTATTNPAAPTKQTWLRSSSGMGREGPHSRMAAVEKNRIVVGS